MRRLSPETRARVQEALSEPDAACSEPGGPALLEAAERAAAAGRAGLVDTEAAAAAEVEAEQADALEALLQRQLDELGRRDRRRAARELAGSPRRRERVSRVDAVQRAAAEPGARRFEAAVRSQWVAEHPRRPVPSMVWLMAWTIMRSDRDEPVQGWLRWARWRYGARGLSFIVQAALCPDTAGGTRYDWTDTNARRFAVGMLALIMQAEAFRGRKRGEALCVRGIPRTVLQALMRDRRGHAPGMSWYSGDLRYARPEAERPLHHLGFLRRLERVGFVRRVQLPAQAAGVEDFERFPDRDGVMRTSNRYYLPWSDLEVEFDREAELVGWMLSTMIVRRTPRTRAERQHADKQARARAPD